jgi:pimeloyl-ACP methyl ester carboxylesterase/GNAT superfamily N-acetyltransferase
MSAIRPCRDDERDAILAIVNAAAEAYRGVIPADRWHEPYMSAADLDREIADGVVFWGSEADGALVGVMGVQAVRDVDLIRHAYVAPGSQRRGVGGALLRHLSRGQVRPLLVGTWAAADWAVRFYERHGFTPVGPERTAELLRAYWSIPDRQIETSVVLARPATGVVTAGGVEIAYERAGSGPPLVLVHGAAGDGRLWRPQLAGLSDEFTVVAWDEPGAGRSSDVPEGFGLAGYADCLAAVIEALALGPAHVAGLSWGGTVVLELYRRRPQLVATLLLVDTYAGWKGSLPAEEVQARVAHAREMLAAPPAEFDPTLPGLFAGDPPPRVVALLEEVAAAVRPRSLGQQLAIMAEADLRDVLPQIAVPTLLVWGERDARSPLDVAHAFAEAIPRAELVVLAGCGHVSNLERPDEVNAAVRRFCRGQAGGSP